MKIWTKTSSRTKLLGISQNMAIVFSFHSIQIELMWYIDLYTVYGLFVFVGVCSTMVCITYYVTSFEFESKNYLTTSSKTNKPIRSDPIRLQCKCCIDVSEFGIRVIYACLVLLMQQKATLTATAKVTR